jgi:hypothetical protein
MFCQRQLTDEQALRICDILGIAKHRDHSVQLRDYGHAWGVFAHEAGSNEHYALISRDDGVNLIATTPDGKQIISTVESTNIMVRRVGQLQPNGSYIYGPNQELNTKIGEGIREMEQDIFLLIRDYLQPRRPSFSPDGKNPNLDD